MAKDLALRRDLEVALELGFQEMVVETDNAVVYGAWAVVANDRSYLAAVVRDCVVLSRSFHSFDLLLIRRTTNLVANYMAKFTVSLHCYVWIEEYPPRLESILASDVSSFDD